jgi:hypothetical protein
VTSLEVLNFIFEVTDGVFELANGPCCAAVEVVDFIVQMNDLVVGHGVLLVGCSDGLLQVL